MGAFERKAQEQRDKAMQAQIATDGTEAQRAKALTQIELDARDVLPAIRRCLDDESKAANGNGFRATVLDIRDSAIPEVGAALQFARTARTQPRIGATDDGVYTVKVIVQADRRIHISASKGSTRGAQQKLLEKEDLGSLDQWPFPARIEDYLLKAIDESEKR